MPAFLLLACGVSWTVWAPLWLPAFGVDGLPVVPVFHHALGALGPIAAAFAMSAREAGPAGVRDLIRRMGLWRGRVVWLMTALLSPFLLVVMSVAAAVVVEGESLSLAGLGRSTEFPQFSALGFIVYNVISFGYGEEVGWRGFALPRLQARRSAFVATLLLTCGWALWHLPLFFYRPGYVSMSMAGIVGWFASLLTGAVLLTWLYNESRGSLLVVAIFHATVDVAFTSELSSGFVVNATGVLITLWGVAVLVGAGPRYLSRRGKVVRLDGNGNISSFVPRGRNANG